MSTTRQWLYRYITKPWDLESLHADLRNALELAVLRGERDSLLREKMLVQQQQLLGHRAGQLALACAGFLRKDAANAVHVFLETALAVGCEAPTIDWRRWTMQTWSRLKPLAASSSGSVWRNGKRHFAPRPRPPRPWPRWPRPCRDKPGRLLAALAQG